VGAIIDLNTATLAQLDTVPGVGPVTAQAILDYRTKHGKFTKIEELQEVDGIGTKTYAQIAPHVRV
jgi:competence protein ComEA